MDNEFGEMITFQLRVFVEQLISLSI